MSVLRVLSYNIHKGFSTGNFQFVLEQIKQSIVEVQADLVFLQEVKGEHQGLSQFEYLADTVWPHYTYGKNSVYSSGHHGNAILSKFPIVFSENQDLSVSRFEKRGVLHAVIDVSGRKIHVFSLHLSLLESYRREQIHSFVTRIESMVPVDAPILLGGDFNDWRQRASEALQKKLRLGEVFSTLTGSHAKTFPSWLPLMHLDRIYYRDLLCESAEVLSGGRWRNLSDHLPIVATFSS